MLIATASKFPKASLGSSVSRGGSDSSSIGRYIGNSDDNVSAKVKELRRFTEESHRYWVSLGYTEDTFIDMVEEEIHAYRKDAVRQEALVPQ